MNTYLTNSNILRSETDSQIISNLLRKGWVECPQPPFDPENENVEWNEGFWVIKPIKPLSYSAEEWLTSQGYTSVIILALLDLENKLKEKNKTGNKLKATRTWINEILSKYIQDPVSKSNWSNSPYTPQETIAEAFMVLNSQD